MIDQNIFAVVLDKVRAANNALVADGVLPAGIDQSRIVVEPPREAAHGDMATNAAMVLAKDAGKKPRDLAEAIAAKLRADDLVAKVDVAGPGFINLTLKPAAWIAALARGRLAAGADYGRAARRGRASPVNVEYVSANPTGPMHVGHCRGAVFGDALANLLAFTGFEVTREYYINDAGAQVDVLARSAFLRYREALGEEIGAIPEGLYPGDYLKPVGAALAAEYGRTLTDKPESDWLPIVRDRADRDDDGGNPRRSRSAQRRARRLLLRALAASKVHATTWRETHRRAAAAGPRLRGPAAAAQGRPDRGLGGPRADAVPRDRFRRRRRPAADEIRRQLHLFRLRHRLPQDQVRSRLSRP